MKRIIWVLIAGVVLAFGLSACSKPEARPRELVVMTHDSFDISAQVIAAFEKQEGVKVRILKAGDAGAALSKAIITAKTPTADVFFGVDNTFLSRALKSDLFTAYASPALSDVPAELRLDETNRLLPVDFGDVCLNYDRKWFKLKGLRPPSSLDDLIRPEYRGLTVVENPATSSPGLAFLLATIARYGEAGYLNYWRALKRNEVLVVDGWEEAYWTNFTNGGKGDRPIVVSYATSPAAEVHFAGHPLKEAPTAAVPDGAFRQIEFVGIFKNARQPELARRFVDFTLSKPFQQDIPLKMFVFPASRTAELPAVFKQHAIKAEQPLKLDPALIDAHRDEWLQAFSLTMLR